MSRFIFAAAASFVFSLAAAAQVPGRDLLEFPLGTLAEPPALSRQLAGGLWNPAATVLPADVRMQLGIAALTTSPEVGVDAKFLGGAFQVRRWFTATVSFAQVDVGDIFKTETDPQSLGSAIPYGTTVASLGAAKRYGAWSFGTAARYRWGSLDTATTGAFSMDFGVYADRVFGTPLRVAASTFLLRPAGTPEPATLLAAADFPLIARDTSVTLRGGIAVQRTIGRGREEYFFAAGTYRQFDARVGIAQGTAFGNVNHRARLGAGFHAGRYAVGIAREDGAAGLGASYQFLLSTMFR